MENLQFLYWHWLLLGIILVGAEMFLASFMILWFGLGALVVGLVLLIFPTLPLTYQLLLWTILSSAFAVFWFKYFQPRMVDKTKAGIAREAAIGESGTVVKIPVEGKRGVVRFVTPILGDDEWEFVCEQPLETGDRVFIQEFSGNTLIVTKL